MYSRIEIAPITRVDTVGVRYLGWILAKDSGSAPEAAIDSVVRAVGKIVVWVEAAAELSTMRISSRDKTVPSPEVPKIAPPVTDSTSNWCAGFVSPTPLPPTPANACIETITITYVTSSRTVEMIAARPGVWDLFAVSSFTDKAVSQPQ